MPRLLHDFFEGRREKKVRRCYETDEEWWGVACLCDRENFMLEGGGGGGKRISLHEGKGKKKKGAVGTELLGSLAVKETQLNAAANSSEFRADRRFVKGGGNRE